MQDKNRHSVQLFGLKLKEEFVEKNQSQSVLVNDIYSNIAAAIDNSSTLGF
jgi:hypothetical protein